MQIISKETPRCTTVQEQMDPDIPPFTLDYVTTEQTTFIRIEGERYINNSVPLRSTVNMSCFYNGKIKKLNLVDQIAFNERIKTLRNHDLI